MNNALRIAVCSSAMALMLTGVACKKPAPPPPAVKNLFAGTWQGNDTKGNTFSISFTNDAWESHIIEGGAQIPQYKGTYTSSGMQLDLTITHEGDDKTMGWVKQRGNYGPNFKADLKAGVMELPFAVTDAKPRKKN
jgi:hypothetical protein